MEYLKPNDKKPSKSLESFITGKGKYKTKIGELNFVVDKHYKIVEKVGKGAYGSVVKALDMSEKDEANQLCAIKKIEGIFDHSLYAKRCLRELKILRLLQHDNIISIKEVLLPEKKDFEDVYVVYDLMETDLSEIIKSKQPLESKHVKYFLYQIISGVKHMHDANIIHRDLKPKNLLVNSDCVIKICDFGLARPLFENFCNNADLTEYIATRWYRPPEVLLGWDKYDKSIDIWSIGCIFAEILGRRPLFPGHETTEQIELIVQVLGTPKIETIYKDGRTNSREQIFKFGEIEKTDFKEMFPDASLEAIDLLEKMLRFDPDKRITIDEAIRHKYFNDLPLEPGEKPEKVGEYDFEFEKFELNLTELRELILYESLLYHDEKIFEEYLKKREKFNSAKEKLRRLESENPKTSLSDSISTNKNSIKSNGKSYKDITKHVKKK